MLPPFSFYLFFLVEKRTITSMQGMRDFKIFHHLVRALNVLFFNMVWMLCARNFTFVKAKGL